jgi:hypothetical protein
MTKKIIARLENENFALIFNQNNPEFNTIAECYSHPSLNDENCFEFNPEKKMEFDEWHYLTFTAEQKETFIRPYLGTITSSDATNTITGEDYPSIRAICLIEYDASTGEELILLSRVFPRNYTLSKKVIKWHDGPQVETQAASIDFVGNVDAYWNGQRLYFKSYAKIKSVFPGLEFFYRSATEDEKNEFLASDLFECEPAIEIGERNLKKIAAVMDNQNINFSDEESKNKYLNYAREYPGVSIVISDSGKICIKSNRDITNILNILEERLYTTPITSERREAHAVTKLDS